VIIHRLHKFSRPITQIIILATGSWLLVTLTGCDAFVRKFTRKKKQDKFSREEMVLVPEEYKGPQMSGEQLYRQYFLFWKSWQGELITWLSPGANHKKQIDCAKEAIKNLTYLKEMLNEEKGKELDVYVSQLGELKSAIEKDTYNKGVARHRQSAERLRRNILRDFSYRNIKDYLIAP